jgi:alpha-glucosidase (family GH31 glycosyl hydrolase)
MTSIKWHKGRLRLSEVPNESGQNARTIAGDRRHTKSFLMAFRNMTLIPELAVRERIVRVLPRSTPACPRVERWRIKMATWFIVILATIWGVDPRNLYSQTQPSSTSQDSGDVMTELGREVIRPSRISGGQLLKKALPLVPVVVSETAQVLHLETDLWQLEVQKANWELRLTNKLSGAEWKLVAAESHSASSLEGGTDSQDRSSVFGLTEARLVQRDGNRWILQGKIGSATLPVALEIAVLTPNIIRFSLTPQPLGNNARLGLSFVGDGPFFGLGERFVKAKLDGLKTTLRTADDFGVQGHNWTYLPVPFLFSPHGLGLYLDTARPSTFDLTRVEKKEFSIQLEEPSTDCYFFVDSGPKGIVQSYTSLTGRTPLPPPWAFGVWVNVTKGLHDLGAFYNEGVLSEAQRLRELRIPASALWIQDFVDPTANLGWPLWTVGFYGAPRQVAQNLHKLGFKVLVYTNPWVNSILAPYLLPNPVYQQGEHEGNFVLGPDGRVTSPVAFEGIPTGNIDFTKPEAVSWWEGMKQKSVVEYDFDGWMEDFGEQVKDTDRFAVGKTGAELANLYPLLYHKTTYEIAHRLKPDVVEFSRSGYAGSQSYTPVLWGGDQFPNWAPDIGLPSLVAAGITAGLSGFAIWGPDIQSAGTSKELWIRWLELGALSPIMRDHKWNQPKWAVDLWFDSETIDLFRRYAGLHISLFPYFYTYAQEATRTGLPIIRHLMLEYPDDPMAWDAENEYLLGERILVAPVITQGATTRSLYLPKGAWMDYWTGELLDGGRQVEVPAPLERIPILIRAGSVIPLISPETQTLASDLAGEKYRTLDNNLTWRVIPAYGSAHDSFTLSDGTRASVSQESSRIEVHGQGSPVIRQYQVILPAAGAPKEVVLSGESLERLDDIGYRVHKRGWWLSPDQRTLRVLFSSDNFTLAVLNR